MKNDSLADSAVIITIGQIIVKISEIVLALILVRILNQTDYGSYRQVWLVYATLSSILLLGIPRSVYYFIPTLSGDQKKLFIIQTMFIMLAVGLVTAVGIFVFSGRIALHFNNTSKQG